MQQTDSMPELWCRFARGTVRNPRALVRLDYWVALVYLVAGTLLAGFNNWMEHGSEVNPVVEPDPNEDTTSNDT